MNYINFIYILAILIVQSLIIIIVYKRGLKDKNLIPSIEEIVTLMTSLSEKVDKEIDDKVVVRKTKLRAKNEFEC